MVKPECLLSRAYNLVKVTELGLLIPQTTHNIFVPTIETQLTMSVPES